jgi:hypothetical protein
MAAVILRRKTIWAGRDSTEFAGNGQNARVNISGTGVEVFPDNSLAKEHWRLFGPKTSAPHFVFF